jgi:hypothetical protein
MNDTLRQGFVNVPPGCPTKWLILTFTPVVKVRPLTPSWDNLTCVQLTTVLFEGCTQKVLFELKINDGNV